MRITNKVINDNYLRNLLDRQYSIAEIQKQISSGKMFDRPSENVIGASHSVILNKILNMNERYLKNIQYANDINLNAETSLTGVNNDLHRVRELAIRVANENNSPEALYAIYQEIQNILERTIEEGNASPNGIYIWGGFKTDKPPFQALRDIVINGTNLAELGISTWEGANSNKLEVISSGAIAAGAFALNNHGLIINGIEIDGFNTADTTRTSFQNAQKLVDLINAKVDKTGVYARIVNPNNGTFSNPNLAGMTPLDNYGIALSNQVVMKGGVDYISNAAGILNVGDLIINGVDIVQANGGTPITLPGGTSEANANVIVNAINNVSHLTKVTATTNIDFTTTDRRLILNTHEPEFTITTSVAGHSILNFQNTAGQDTYKNINKLPLEQEIKIDGTDNGKVTRLFNSQVNLRNVIAIGNTVTSGVYTINSGDIRITDNYGNIYNVGGINCNGNSEQNATKIAEAINNAVSHIGIVASTNYNGRIIIKSNPGTSFRIETSGNGVNANLINRWYTHLSGTDTVNAGSITLRSGSLVINGINIIDGVKTYNFGSSLENAKAIARDINAKTEYTGIFASVEDLGGGIGRLIFSNSTSKITDVRYLGDTGENFAGTGQAQKIALNISGDKAFSGTLSTVQVMGSIDITGTTNLNLAAGNLQINGVNIGAVVAPNVGVGPAQVQANLNALINAINSQSHITGVIAKQDPSGNRILLYSKGQDIQISSNNGVNLFNQTGLSVGTTKSNMSVFNALIRLRDQVLNNINSRDPVVNISQVHIKEIDEALNNIVLNRTELGARGEHLSMVENRIKDLNVTIKQQLSNVQDADITKIITNYSLQETIYRAALALGGRILPQTLLNFLH